MAITAVGTLASGTGVTSVAVTTHAAGNALVMAVKIPDGTTTVTGVSGGNATWTLLAGPYVDTAGTPHTHYLYLGKVTAAGAGTVTVTLSSATAADMDVQEFTNSDSSTTWALDGTQAGIVNKTAASTTVTWPSLTPAGSGELYAGHARCPAGGNVSGIAGFTVQVDANGNPFIYGLVSAVTAPSGTDLVSTDDYATGALVVASVPAPPAGGAGSADRHHVRAGGHGR